MWKTVFQKFTLVYIAAIGVLSTAYRPCSVLLWAHHLFKLLKNKYLSKAIDRYSIASTMILYLILQQNNDYTNKISFHFEMEEECLERRLIFEELR